MLPVNTTAVQPKPVPAWLVLLFPLGAVIVSITFATKPLILIGLLIAIPVALAVLRKPDLLIPVVTFLIFINAPVVAVQYHRVPFVIAAAIPMLLVLPVAHQVFIKRQPIILTGATPPLFLFMLVQLLGVPHALRSDDAAEVVFASLTEGMVLYLLVLNVIRSSSMLRQVIWALLLAGTFLGALGLFQQVTRTYNKNYGGFAQVSNAAFEVAGSRTGQLQPRLAGPIGEKNFYAQYMLMLIPLGLSRWWAEERTELRVLALACCFLIGIGAALTFSRGAMVGFGVLVMMMMLAGYIRVRHLIPLAIGTLLICLTVPALQTRFQKLLDAGSGDISTQSRLTEMMAAAMVFVDHPIVGVGPGMFRYHYEDYADIFGLRLLAGDRASHNLYLGMAAENGLLGILCFLAFLGITLYRLRRGWVTARSPAAAHTCAAFFFSLIAFMATSMFLNFAYVRYFWLLAAIAGAAPTVMAAEIRSPSDPIDSTSMESR